MDATTETTSVEREVAIAASPQTVWAFLVEPDKATRWMGQTASLDAQPGGEYRVGVIPGHTASGEFVEVDPPRRVVFTWGWEPGPQGPEPGRARVEHDRDRAGPGRRRHDASVPPLRAAVGRVGYVACPRLGPLPGAARERGGWRRPRGGSLGSRRHELSSLRLVAGSTMADLDQLALAMPRTTKAFSNDGRPRYSVHGKLFCCHRTQRPDAVDPDTGERLDDVLMFRVADLGVKELLLADSRGIYFTTPHFDGYPAVLMRITDLGRIDRDELLEIVAEAWLTRAQKRVANAWLAEHGLSDDEAKGA